MRCSWWNGVDRLMRIGGDGNVAFSLASRAGRRYESSFALSKENHQTLAGLLAATDWLQKPPEKVVAVDAVEFSLSLMRDGKRTGADFMVQRREPYQSLRRFLSQLERQEFLQRYLCGSDNLARLEAARKLSSNLGTLMGQSGTSSSTLPMAGSREEWSGRALAQGQLAQLESDARVQALSGRLFPP